MPHVTVMVSYEQSDASVQRSEQGEVKLNVTTVNEIYFMEDEHVGVIIFVERIEIDVVISITINYRVKIEHYVMNSISIVISLKLVKRIVIIDNVIDHEQVEHNNCEQKLVVNLLDYMVLNRIVEQTVVD